MRICQLLVYPNDYLRRYHEANPGYASLSFKEQSAALAENMPSSSLQWQIALEAEGHEVRLIVANDWVSQQQWVQEKMDTHGSEKTSSTQDIVVEQLRKIKADILLIMSPEIFGASFVRRIRSRVRIIAGWSAESLPKTLILKGFDWFFSPLEEVVQNAKKQGASRVHLLPQGFPRTIAETVFQTPQQLEVICIGRYKQSDALSSCVIDTLVQTNHRLGSNFRLGLYISPSAGSILPNEASKLKNASTLGREYFKAISSALVAVVLPSPDQFPPQQLLEATGIGVATLAFHNDLDKTTFKLGNRSQAYSQGDDLLIRIQELLNDDNQKKRRMLAAEGQEHCLEQHSMDKVVKEFLRVLEQKPNGWISKISLRFGSQDG